MIETTARVVALDAHWVWVETVRQSACGHCESAGSCATPVLAQLFGRARTRLQVPAGSGLKVGEEILIAIPSGTLVRASLVAYLLPLTVLVAAAGLATWLGASEATAALSGLAGLGTGLWASGRLTGGRSARERYRPVLVRRAAARERPCQHPASAPGAPFVKRATS